MHSPLGLSVNNVRGKQSGGRSISTRGRHGKDRLPMRGDASAACFFPWLFLVQIAPPLLCSPAHMANCKEGPLSGEGVPQTGAIMHQITASCTTVHESAIFCKTALDKDILTPPFGRAKYPSYRIDHHANKTPP